MDDDEFGHIFASADRVPGWLTRDQARVLHDEARRLGPDAIVVEIGSHQGRSTTVLAAALRSGTVVAVDPFITTRRYAGPSVRVQLERHLSDRGLSHRVDVVADYSRAVRERWSEPIDLLFVDGKHDMGSCIDDLRWRSHLRPGDRVLVHDAFSSLGVTLGLLVAALPSRDLIFLDRTGSLARFEIGPPSPRSRLLLIGQTGWWVRNLFIKVLLRLRLHRIARLIGHDQPGADPY
ncbi:MAG: hypothetical protein JWR55_1096 [Aeromicrobium sp.]|nr:hypothetical protein [Aeromicrobium sp.]